MGFQPGQMLFGKRYTLIKQLGEGAYGITWLAKDAKNQFIAIKTLKENSLTTQPEQRDKIIRSFEKEIKMLGVCDHPHIVKIKNTFSDNEVPCIAMEYIDGETLWQRVERTKTALPQLEALKYVHQIGEALVYLHEEKGHLHQDVKPRNIMVRKPKNSSALGEAVLIDFGFAREFILGLTQQYSNVPGAHGFAAPELYRQQLEPTEAIDVYALAATLYYLLTTKAPNPPFINERTPEAREINLEVSPEVSQAIVEGMAHDLRYRCQTVQDWLKLLPIVAKPIYQFGDRMIEFDLTDPNQDTPPIDGILPMEEFFEREQQNSPQPLSIKETIQNVLNWFRSEETPTPTKPQNQQPSKTPQKPPVSPVQASPLVAAQPAAGISVLGPNSLQSERGVNYTRLRDLLKASNWQEADIETAKRMSEAIGKPALWLVRSEDFLTFPCQDLKTINALWVKYSQGKFGFSVQKQIYVKCGAKLDGEYPGDKIWEDFGHQIQWRKDGQYILYKEETFSTLPFPFITLAPPGHLPGVFFEKSWSWGPVVCGLWWALFSIFSHRDL